MLHSISAGAPSSRLRPLRASLSAVSLALTLASGCGDTTPPAAAELLDASAAPSATSEGSVGGAIEAGTRDAGAIQPGRSDAGLGVDDASTSSAPDSSSAGDSGPRFDAGRDSGVTTTRDGGAAYDGMVAVPSEAGAPIAGRKFVGNITTNNQVRSDFADYWDQITPENEGKWGSVEATRNQMSWAGLDRVRDYARQHGLIFKQHTLVWGSQQPSWLNGLSAAEQRSEVEQWIRLFCERYPDVDQIDVVNEPPPHTTPAYLDAIGGAGASGYDWIVQSFKWARQYCPKATLILNDYNTIEYGGDNTRFIAIANAIKAAGAPIDALGAQAHDAYKLSTNTVQQMIDKLATSTGLPIYITEYDIGIADDAEQQRVMQSQFTMFWNNPNVKGITFWGYVVGATWRPNTGLMSASGTRRPALTWLMDFLDASRIKALPSK